MTEVKVKIGENEYVLKFGMYFLRQLAKHWNLPTFNEVLHKLSAFDGIKDDNVPWEMIDLVVDMYYIGIKVNANNSEITIEELYDCVLIDMKQTTKVIQAMSDSLVSSFANDKKKHIPKDKK